MTIFSSIRYACIASLLCSPAFAKSPIAEVLCEPTSHMHDKLERQFGSQRTATGVRSPEQVMEIWTSQKGDWTMVVTYSTGTSCIVAMGEHWQAHAGEKPARG